MTDAPRPDPDDVFNRKKIRSRPSIDPARTAVLVIDMVEWQVPRSDRPDLPREMAYYAERLETVVIPRTRELIAAGREAGATIAYVRCGAARFDAMDAIPQFREVLVQRGAFEGTRQTAVIPELAPQPGDIDLLKTGTGAFTSTALDQRFRNVGIEHVLYTGVITNACVLASLTAGFDLGYYGYMVADATATVSPDIQSMTETIVDFVLGQVVVTDTAVAWLQGDHHDGGVDFR
jgi:nicotinamidase-related amidase